MSEPKTVLIVDDSLVTRMMVRAIVSELHPEWTIIEAADSDDALSKAVVDVIDLMILDYNIPGPNGLILARALKEKYPQCRITLLTANIQDSIRRKAEDQGLDFVKKPITEERIHGIMACLES